jgi:hypothetical protein
MLHGSEAYFSAHGRSARGIDDNVNLVIGANCLGIIW